MLKNLTIKSRLIFILSFLVAFLLGVQMLGLFGMSSAIDGLKTVYHDRAIPLKQVGRYRVASTAKPRRHHVDPDDAHTRSNRKQNCNDRKEYRGNDQGVGELTRRLT